MTAAASTTGRLPHRAVRFLETMNSVIFITRSRWNSIEERDVYSFFFGEFTIFTSHKGH